MGEWRTEKVTWGKHFINANKKSQAGFPGGPVVGNLPANAGDTGLIPDL